MVAAFNGEYSKVLGRLRGQTALVLGMALFLIQMRMGAWLATHDVAVVTPIEHARSLWDPALLRILSFGHLPVVVDALWIKSLQDTGLHKAPTGTHPALFYRLDLLTELDSAFYHAYFAGANLLAVARDDGAGARDLLLKAAKFQAGELKQYPDSFLKTHWSTPWNLQLLLAYVYLFELDDLARASKAFQEAASLGGGPPYLKRLADRLSRPGGEYEVGLRLLNFLISHSKEPKAQEKLVRKRNHLFVAQYLADLNRGFRDYLTELPEYKASHDLSVRAMERYWKKYRRDHQVPPRDPWGGHVALDDHGRIVTTTPYEKVFGLE